MQFLLESVIRDKNKNNHKTMERGFCRAAGKSWSIVRGIAILINLNAYIISNYK